MRGGRAAHSRLSTGTSNLLREAVMRTSQLLIPTTREVPAEAEIPSHQLMIRAGFIRKLASGAYTYLPLGWRVLRKIMAIVREEMDAAGAQEILLPAVQPMDLWRRTGRDVDYGQTMAHFTDRHGRENVLAPTAEEVVTFVAAQEIKSYKQLPINLYQISFKFRDEFRPRFGVLRSREFIMKDAYSFNATPESLAETYRAMYEAYQRIFDRCGVPYVIVEAETGEMGGSGSHQFTVPCDNGEDVIVYTEDGSYAASIEKAETDERPHDLTGEPTGELENVATPGVTSVEDVIGFFKKQLKTKLKPENMLKTLVCRAAYAEDAAEGEAGPEWVVAVVRGDHELNEEKLLCAVRGKHPATLGVRMADEQEAKGRGFAVGFVGPHVNVPCLMVVDPDAAQGGFWVTGGNATDTHAKHFNWRRDVRDHAGAENVLVADIRNAIDGDTHGGKPLRFKRGIEVGQVFQLGTKYTRKLDCTFLDEAGASRPCLMGCYGIGVNRIFASAIETGHDENGCILPAAIAPFEVLVVPLNNDSEPVTAEAERIYSELKAAGADVLIDDRDARPGVKFKDADLIGFPLRIVVGDRGLKDGAVEIKRRTDEEPICVPVADAVAEALRMLGDLR